MTNDINKEHNKWPYAKILDDDAISTRVDIAKMALHSSIISSSNPDEIFIEDILNIFIALVQHPVNFAFFDESKNCIFHFCKDPFHKGKFEKYISKLDSSNEDIYFEFFNYDKNSPKRYLAIVYMDTKLNRNFKTISKAHRNEPIERPLKEESYLAICANEYFEIRWSSFKSYSSSSFLDSVSDSISHLSRQHDNEEELIKIGVGKQDTKKLVNRLSIAVAGISKSSSYVKQLAYDTVGTKRRIETPTTMFTFRDYGVQEGYSRYKGLYDYKSRFVCPDITNSISQHMRILKNMKSKYPMDEGRGPESCIEKYKIDSFNGIAYSSIQVSDERKELTRELDHRFWALLHSEGKGAEFLINHILASPVSEEARSLVDPVYQTGLIHYNRVFENAGLDRIDSKSINKIDSRNMLSIRSDGPGIEIDLLRIVVLYYLVTGVFENSKQKLEHAKDILCVMFPVKIKGVCWGVAIQALHVKRTQLDLITDSHDLTQHRHGEQHEWISRFLLTTTFRRRLFSIIDSTCWEHAHDFVIDSIVRVVGDLMARKGGARENEIKLNGRMSQISGYLPYGFPIFNICTVENAVKKGYYKYARLNPPDGNICIAWDLSDNPYYNATHPWTKKSTRSFTNAIELGLEIANDELQRNANKLTDNK